MVSNSKTILAICDKKLNQKIRKENQKRRKIMKKSRRKLVSVIGILICLCMVIGCGSTADSTTANQTTVESTATTSGTDNAGASSELPEIVLRLSTNTNENDDKTNAAMVGLKAAVAYVEKATEGKLKIEVYWGGVLGTSADDVLGGLQNGSFEMCGFAHGNWGEYTDGLVPFNIPYLFTSQEALSLFIDGEGGKLVCNKVLADTGLRILAFGEYGFRNMTSNTGIIKSPDDLKGVKIRTMTDPYQIAAFEQMGAAVTPIAWSELFSALQQGVVDAQENPLANIYTSKLYEVQKYLAFTKHNVSINTFTISESVYQSLPQEYQKVLDEAGVVNQEACRKALTEQEEDLRARLESDECGMILYDLTDEELQAFQDAVIPSWDVIKKDIGEERFQEIIDIVTAIDTSLEN